MPLTYATAADYEDFIGEEAGGAPENIDALLRAASSLVRRATRTAVYDVDSAGKPSDTDVLQAFMDATCAQAQTWVTLDVDPTAGPAGVAGQVQSSSMLSASVTYAAREGADADKVATLSSLVPDALWYLESAGVLNQAPWVT